MPSTNSTSALTPQATARYQKQVEAAAAALRKDVGSLPSTALLLGVGGSAVRDALDPTNVVSYADLPHMPGEAKGGTVAVGTWEDTPVVVLDTPLPLHDGYTPREAVFPVRMLGAAGIDTLLLTGAAGGIRSELKPGTLMVLTDHINFQGVNPLVGPNVDDWGPRFPDMTEPYAPALRRAADRVARENHLSLRKGVYLGALGPTLGTGAEYRMMRTLGADAVGMGLVPEVIAARHMDVRVGGVAVITDRCSTESPAPVTAEELHAAAADAQPQLLTLLGGLVGAAQGDELTA